MHAENEIVQNEIDRLIIQQQPEHREAVQVIAGEWDRPGQDVYDRRLILSSVTGSWQTSHHIIQVDGTPPRGMVIIPASAGGKIVRMNHTHLTLSHSKSVIVRELLSRLLTMIEETGSNE